MLCPSRRSPLPGLAPLRDRVPLFVGPGLRGLHRQGRPEKSLSVEAVAQLHPVARGDLRHEVEQAQESVEDLAVGSVRGRAVVARDLDEVGDVPRPPDRLGLGVDGHAEEGRDAEA
ncbi:hypothetical protein D3C74_431900 [compost metagenome]